MQEQAEPADGPQKWPTSSYEWEGPLEEKPLKLYAYNT